MCINCANGLLHNKALFISSWVTSSATSISNERNKWAFRTHSLTHFFLFFLPLLLYSPCRKHNRRCLLDGCSGWPEEQHGWSVGRSVPLSLKNYNIMHNESDSHQWKTERMNEWIKYRANAWLITNKRLSTVRRAHAAWVLAIERVSLVGRSAIFYIEPGRHRGR